MMKQCAVYMRYSSDNQHETSIEYQRNEITAYCCNNNYEIVEEYVDRAHTGTNDRRPSFQRLFNDVQNKPPWDVILVYDYSRYSRDFYDCFYYLKILRECKIQLISITEPIDPGDDFAIMRQCMIFSDNQRYSKHLAERVHLVLENKAKRGEHCGGIPPLGYNVDEHSKLQINEEEAEIVREIFDLVEQGRSYSWMAEYLNNKGYKTKIGTPFRKNSFLSILRQEKYIGINRWNRSASKDELGHRNNHASKPEVEHTINTCPAIISTEQFFNVQKRLKARSGGKAESKSRRNYMLSGMMITKCAECGHTMVGTTCVSHGNHYEAYRCPNHKEHKTCTTKDIRADSLNKYVSELIVEHIMTSSGLNEINKLLAEKDSNAELIKKKLRIQKSIGRLASALEYSYSEHLIDRIKKLEIEFDELNAIIEKNNSISLIDEKNIKIVKNNIKNFLQTSDSPVVKKLILQMIESVEISNDEVIVVLKNVV